MRLNFHSTVFNKVTSWLTLWVMLTMLGQAVLPTLAYLHSESNPELWTEICSVAGVRQTTQPGNDNPAAAHHADCPLCLQASLGIIHDFVQLSTSAVFFLLNQISRPAIELQQFSLRTALPEARAPPEFN